MPRRRVGIRQGAPSQRPDASWGRIERGAKKPADYKPTGAVTFSFDASGKPSYTTGSGEKVSREESSRATSREPKMREPASSLSPEAARVRQMENTGVHPTKAPQSLQTGAKGGQFYISSTGAKVYVGKGRG